MSLFVNHKTPKTEEPPKAKDKRICPQLIPPTWPIHTIHKNNETVIFVACWTTSPAMEASTQCGGVSILWRDYHGPASSSNCFFCESTTLNLHKKISLDHCKTT